MRRIILLVTVGAVVAATMALGGVASASSGNSDLAVKKGLAQVRLATAKYHNVEAAKKAGYVPVSPCVECMGYHYANMGNLEDGKVGAGGNARKPEVLLYAPSANGKLKLVGVEYLVFDTGQARPTLFGEVPFEGPMTHGLPQHYDLHVWTWKHNPDGIFTAHNPNVRC